MTMPNHRSKVFLDAKSPKREVRLRPIHRFHGGHGRASPATENANSIAPEHDLHPEGIEVDPRPHPRGSHRPRGWSWTILEGGPGYFGCERERESGCDDRGYARAHGDRGHGVHGHGRMPLLYSSMNNILDHHTVRDRGHSHIARKTRQREQTSSVLRIRVCPRWCYLEAREGCTQADDSPKLVGCGEEDQS